MGRERNSGKKGLKQFADAPAWERELTAVYGKKNTSVTFQIAADISVPQAEQMSVIEVEEPEFTSTYKKKLAERIFGSEEVYYYDISHLPIEELKERHAYWEEKPSAFYNTQEWEEVLAVCEEEMEYYHGQVVNGYVFYYDLGIENVSFADFGTEESYLSLYNKKKDTEKTRYSMETRMEVYVTEAGVIRMNAMDLIYFMKCREELTYEKKKYLCRAYFVYRYGLTCRM